MRTVRGFSRLLENSVLFRSSGIDGWTILPEDAFALLECAAFSRDARLKLLPDREKGDQPHKPA